MQLRVLFEVVCFHVLHVRTETSTNVVDNSVCRLEGCRHVEAIHIDLGEALLAAGASSEDEAEWQAQLPGTASKSNITKL